MLNGLDLFSGIGGITLALAEWVKPVAYCEIEPYAQAVLISRMSEGLLPAAPIWDDVRTLKASDLPEIDIITGGFPCQDVSSAGLRKGLDGERTGLFREAIRLIRECKPKFVFFENVQGIKKYVFTVRGELEELGYTCRDGFIEASSVGASHPRQRWWLLAYVNGERCDLRSNTQQERHIQNSKIGESKKIQQKGNQWIDWLSPVHAINADIIEGGVQIGLREREEQKHTPSRDGDQNEIADSAWREKEPGYFMVRMVHGVSYRVDSIKSLGNAVVPLQAKEAFKILMGIKDLKEV